MSESKEQRQAALLELLEETPLFSQAEICEAMEKKGFVAAQPSISRDLRELGIIKISGRYLPPTTLAEQIPSSLSLSVHPAGPYLIVVRTKTGAAHAVAAQIDDLEVEGAVGTVAGDDTIFIALNDPACQRPALDFLQRTLFLR